MSGRDISDDPGRSNDEPSPAPDGAAPAPEPAPDGAAPRPIASATFSLEGRAAPGLYLVGWVATILGLAVLAAVVLSGPGGAGGLVLGLIALVLLSVGLVAAAGAQGLQRRAHHVSGYAGPSPFLVFLATLPVAILGVLLILAPARAAGLDPDSPLGALIQVVLTALVYLGLVRLLVVATGVLSWSAMGIRRVPVPRVLEDLAWGAALALPVVSVTLIVSAILLSVLNTTLESPLPPARDTAGFIVNMLAAAVVAPIGEELFFRGFATTAWLRSIGWRSALIRGALFFALVHILTVGGSTFGDGASRAVIAFAVRIPVALGLGWLFMRRQSLYASIGLHSAFNAILLTLGSLGS